ncbi:hypothetical protein IE53DRAFT_264707 [Violaceomyces palustris]|uniref:Uncharacterized protein n=1 Tax=Violaceomyces palustris TaxID=1673888 RepID=A0ACD0P3J2_9BASI|nr:hypothetical protein IE53DRAFT_264707 [Violaceomyces palustris]
MLKVLSHTAATGWTMDRSSDCDYDCDCDCTMSVKRGIGQFLVKTWTPICTPNLRAGVLASLCPWGPSPALRKERSARRALAKLRERTESRRGARRLPQPLRSRRLAAERVKVDRPLPEKVGSLDKSPVTDQPLASEAVRLAYSGWFETNNAASRVGRLDSISRSTLTDPHYRSP